MSWIRWILLEVDPDIINESLADVNGGGEEIEVDLLKQPDLVEPDDDECILSENEIESDVDVIHTLQLIACLMFIVYIYICMTVVCNNYYFYSCT